MCKNEDSADYTTCITALRYTPGAKNLQNSVHENLSRRFWLILLSMGDEQVPILMVSRFLRLHNLSFRKAHAPVHIKSNRTNFSLSHEMQQVQNINQDKSTILDFV